MERVRSGLESGWRRERTEIRYLIFFFDCRCDVDDGEVVVIDAGDVCGGDVWCADDCVDGDDGDIGAGGVCGCWRLC